MKQGLQNVGNTCSINTLIQCVGHCDRLRAWFLSEGPQRINTKNIPSNGMCLSIELARIIHEMWVQKRSLAPMRFLKTLYSLFQGHIRHGEQLDLQELWMHVVDRVNEEIGIPYETPIIEGGNNDTEGFLDAWKKHNERCMSPFLQMVQGWTSTCIKCNHCRKESKIYEPFSSLGLDISQNVNNFQDMFDIMFRNENLDEWLCDHCKGMAGGIKSTNVCMYPDVMIVYLKRFEMSRSGRMRKIDRGIDIPHHMRFVDMGNENNGYKLSSMGNHVGGLHGGHYYATARIDENRWCTYDDIEISEIEDISKILKNNKEAYMIVYERI